MAERFFDDQPPPPALWRRRQMGMADPVDDNGVVAGLSREIEQDIRLSNRGYLFLQRQIELRILHVPRDIVKVGGKTLPQFFVHVAVFAELLYGVMHALAIFVVAHRSARVADDREGRGKAAVVSQPVQGGQKLTLGQI